ncbi:hypothetical protein BJ875DRAFT_451134 [Amylocarpus encephaloides]|uniref:Uncharacterized protein n=1 Tax=Amylocarpus encephaloides TaxID=45428 RepID=A0A9P7YRH0_9HELO|nr:hypothetical protein BJ875DRAFT_451134 [Amylocarpus encephaloides]
MILSSEAPTAVEASSPPPMVIAAEQPATPTAESPKEITANTTAFSSVVMALANGIHARIPVSNNGFAGTSSLSAMLTENPVDTTLFAAGQSSFLKSVRWGGVVIRQNNQKIMPKGNAAMAGLPTVTMAQMTELNLTVELYEIFLSVFIHCRAISNWRLMVFYNHRDKVRKFIPDQFAIC